MKLTRSLFLIALLCLAGCAGPATLNTADTQAPQPGEPPPALLAQLPPLLSGSEPRTASLIGPLVLAGSMAIEDFGSGVSYGASSVELTPPAQQLTGAIYCLPVYGFSYDEITFDISFDDPAKCWLGVGDYQRGSWDLRVATPGITSITPPYPTARSPYGHAYMVVLAWDDTTVVVHEVAIDPNIPTWQHHVVDDTATDLGRWGDMAAIDGHLYIAHVPWNVDEIRLARALVPAPAGPGDWGRTLVADDQYSDRLELCEVDSLPAIAYADG